MLEAFKVRIGAISVLYTPVAPLKPAWAPSTRVGQCRAPRALKAQQRRNFALESKQQSAGGAAMLPSHFCQRQLASTQPTLLLPPLAASHPLPALLYCSC